MVLAHAKLLFISLTSSFTSYLTSGSLESRVSQSRVKTFQLFRTLDARRQTVLDFLFPVHRHRRADYQNQAGLNYCGQPEEPPTFTSGEEDAGELGRSLLVLRTLGDEPLLAGEPLHGVEKQVFIAQQ